jgi:hypothetical protein
MFLRCSYPEESLIMKMNIYICMYVCMYVCMYIYIYIYIYIYTVVSAQRSLQYFQMQDSRDISRKTFDYSRCIKIVTYLYYCFSRNP